MDNYGGFTGSVGPWTNYIVYARRPNTSSNLGGSYYSGLQIIAGKTYLKYLFFN